ncbi:MAG TPA: hypothetical protein VKB88_46870 [Bryobacteraceae bacterium]|nr:hypothetical protein [Bryobacteraceae bacterium]
MLLNGGALGTAAKMNASAANNPNTINPLSPCPQPGGRLALRYRNRDGSVEGRFDHAGYDRQQRYRHLCDPVTNGQQANFGGNASYLESGPDGGNIEIATQTIDPTTSCGRPRHDTTAGGIVPVGAGDFGPSASGFDYSRSALLEPGAVLRATAGLGLRASARPRRA